MGDGGGTRHREVLFCGSEVALKSDVAVLVVASDIGERLSDFGKDTTCRCGSLLKFLYGFALLPAWFDES